MKNKNASTGFQGLEKFPRDFPRPGKISPRVCDDPCRLVRQVKKFYG
jgi:hypothetical protein